MVADTTENKQVLALLNQLVKAQEELDQKDKEINALNKENAKLKSGKPLKSKQTDGIYEIQRKKCTVYGFKIYDEFGHTVRKEGFGTIAEAQAKRRELLALRDDKKLSLTLKNNSQTFQYFVDEYMKMAEAEFAINTIEATESIIRNHLTSLLELKIPQLTKKMAREWANEYRNKIKASAYNNTLKKVKAIWNYALKIDLTNTPNPFTHLEPISIEKEKKVRKDVRIDKVEMDKLMQAAYKKFDDYTPYIIACAVYAGLREGECLGLNWRDIDFSTNTISINTQLQKVTKKRLQKILDKNPNLSENDVLITTRLKTKASKADIVVPSLLLDLLKEYKKKLMANNNLHELCFCNPDGSPLVARDFVRYKYQKVVKEVFGSETYVHFHELRGSCATVLHTEGVSSKIIQGLLRHSKQQITDDIYIKVDRKSKNVSDELNRVFS